MGRQHVVPVEQREQLLGILAEHRDRVGVDDQGGSGARQGQDIRRVGSPTPAAGPMTAASASLDASSSSSSVSKGLSITASRCAAFIGRASGGDSTVTTPAPILRPARAASRAAPVCQASPLTTIRRPRECL